VVDVASGNEVYSIRTGNSIYTVPLVYAGDVYVGSTDKFLYVIDLVNRCLKKRVHLGSKIFSPPRLIDKRIYVGACNGMVYEIDPADIEITATHQLPDAITNAVTFNANTGHFYALTYTNELFAFAKNSPAAAAVLPQAAGSR
jgi:outer membrane protein assembly factor BamB